MTDHLAGKGYARATLDLAEEHGLAAGAVPPRCPLLSVIVPAYNERDRIAASIASMTEYLARCVVSYELIVVSDGSTDGTDEIARRQARTDPRLRVLSLPRNRGKGQAVKSGIAAARGEYIMFIDADLTIPISIVADFRAALDGGADIAIASRRHPASSVIGASPSRRVMSAVFAWCVRRLIVSDIGDTQCGAKIYRAIVAQPLFAAQRIDHFGFDAEVLYLARRAGFRIEEVPVTLRYRAGSSIRPLRDALLMARDILRIRLYAWRGDYDRWIQ